MKYSTTSIYTLRKIGTRNTHEATKNKNEKYKNCLLKPTS